MRLPDRTTPELKYLETKFASLMPYGLSLKVLEELLPIDSELTTTHIRRVVQEASEQIEKDIGDEKFQYIDGCPRDLAKLPRPAAPITVAIDGGYVRCREKGNAKSGFFEVIAGISSSEDEKAKCLGFVNNYDEKPKRRLYSLLQKPVVAPLPVDH